MTDIRERPPSATHFGINVLGLTLGLVVLCALLHWRTAAIDPVMIVLLSGSSIALSIALGEWCWRRRLLAGDSGLEAAALRSFDPGHALTRLLGFGLTLGTVAFFYWLLPEYHGNFYVSFWHLARLLAPFALPAAAIYFVWSDSRLKMPEDACWHLGRLACGRLPNTDAWRLLHAHALAWTVKAFFLPLMTVYATDQVKQVGGALNDLLARGFMHASYNFIFGLAYAVDLLFCVVGYLLTLRVLDAHIRSTDATLLGWLTALVCYQPFYSVIGPLYLRYDDNRTWSEYFAPYPHIGGLWGAGILMLVILYSLSTVAFGLRFSNLTHRGIITGGPYRYFKHPAYLSKNLSWWMISVPFLSTEGVGTAFRHCVLLGLLNGIYFLRAKTEERHLSADPCYVAYLEWMRDHGAIAKLRRLIFK